MYPSQLITSVALSLVIEDERGGMDRTFPDKGDVQGGNKRDGGFGGKRGYPNWTGHLQLGRAQMHVRGEISIGR
jgi:hypothetical protein